MSQLNFPMERRLKHQKTRSRRTALRFPVSDIPAFKRINLVGGPEVKLINISRRGALIECCEYMSMGSRISLQVTTEEAAAVIKGRVIRCSTASKNDKAPQYQSTIAFDEDFTLHMQALMRASRSNP